MLLSTWAPILTSIDIIYKLNLALFVLLLYICIFLSFCFFDGNKENKQTNYNFFYANI